MVNSFRYLAQVISPADENVLEVVRNLYQAREVWKRITRTLIMKGGGAAGFWHIFKSRGAGGVDLWIGDLGVT